MPLGCLGVRLTIAARVEEAKLLTKPIAEGGKGLSQRQAANVGGGPKDSL
jgi:hypothetical protein